MAITPRCLRFRLCFAKPSAHLVYWSQVTSVFCLFLPIASRSVKINRKSSLVCLSQNRRPLNNRRREAPPTLSSVWVTLHHEMGGTSNLKLKNLTKKCDAGISFNQSQNLGTIPVCTTSKFFADFRFTDSKNQFPVVVFGHADFEYAISFVICCMCEAYLPR